MNPRLLFLFAFLTLINLIISPTFGHTTTIIDEDFESYTNNAELYAVWGPSNSSGTLADETYTEFISSDDIAPQTIGATAFPSGGQGVHHLGGSILEYQLPLNSGVPLKPTEEESLVLQGDIFDVGAIENKRMSIGLRFATIANIVEIGHWNDSAVGFASRTILFASPFITQQPNWQFYELPTELDRLDDDDIVTTQADIGEAWHTHRATIGPTSITYEIDLYRDGLDASTGLPGYDATMTFDVEPTTYGFDAIRFGSPSGITSSGNGFYGGVIFDNISLKVVSSVPEPSSALLGLLSSGLIFTRRSHVG